MRTASDPRSGGRITSQRGEQAQEPLNHLLLQNALPRQPLARVHVLHQLLGGLPETLGVIGEAMATAEACKTAQAMPLEADLGRVACHKDPKALADLCSPSSNIPIEKSQEKKPEMC